MAGDEPSTPSSITAVPCPVAESIPSSPPPHHDVTSLVGSPSHDLPEMTSEDNRDQEHAEKRDHGQEQEIRVPALSENLKHKIIKQVEYYFSNENLPSDTHLMGFIKKNKEGFVPIAVIASFRKMKKLTQDHSLIAAALKDSSALVVSPDGKKVKRLHPMSLPENRDPKLFTVLVENLPEDHSKENIQRIFGEVGRIKSISICDPHVVEKSGKSGKTDVPISNKLYALVEYATLEATEKAVTTLNDVQDWRNGMRVKLLKPQSKHGQRKPHWRGPDPEKNSTGRTSDQIGDEIIQNISEHHDDIPDEEEGGHQTKDKLGHKGRNQGRGRRQKYKGVNGMGHGTTSSSSAHSTEPPKPPPGPKMPDGTRGFTMGRGRPPTTSNQN